MYLKYRVLHSAKTVHTFQILLKICLRHVQNLWFFSSFIKMFQFENFIYENLEIFHLLWEGQLNDFGSLNCNHVLFLFSVTFTWLSCVLLVPVIQIINLYSYVYGFCVHDCIFSNHSAMKCRFWEIKRYFKTK